MHRLRGNLVEMRWLYVSLLLILILTTTSSCASSAKRLATIELGMTKDEVIKKLRKPKFVRGAIFNKFGQRIEVLEYDLAVPKSSGERSREVGMTVASFGILLPVMLVGKTETFWLYFADSKLAKWGKAGDWKAEADSIYELRFNTGEKLLQ